jgi:hypothetical protein
MTDPELDQLFSTIYASNSNAEEVWIAGLVVACVALRRTDELTRERLLRNVERELRQDLVGISKIEAGNDAA